MFYRTSPVAASVGLWNAAIPQYAGAYSEAYKNLNRDFLEIVNCLKLLRNSTHLFVQVKGSCFNERIIKIAEIPTDIFFV